MATNFDQVAGNWNVFGRNTLDYAGASFLRVVTNDGVERYGFNRDRLGNYIYDPQRYELPPGTSITFNLTADGKFSQWTTSDSATYWNGYSKTEVFSKGTYTIQGNILALTETACLESNYVDFTDSSVITSVPPATTYWFWEKVIDAQGNPRLNLTQAAKQADGTYVATSGVLPTQYSGSASSVNPNSGYVWQGTWTGDTAQGTSFQDYINGMEGNDTISGGAGNDVLVGGYGVDQIAGEAGSDRFVLESTRITDADRIVDFNSGEDIVAFWAPTFSGLTADSFIRADQFQVGSAATTTQTRVIYNSATGALFYDSDGSGSASPIQVAALSPGLNLTHDNIYAAQTFNLLYNITKPTTPVISTQPTNGSDSLTGSAGNDTLNGLDGNDTLNGGDGNDQLLGSAGNDSILGGNGSDTLDGGTGTDTLVGGAGNDVYVIDASTDVISEASGAGTDTVNAAITRTLGSNQENLVLTGTATINGTGNSLSNSITGNEAANRLSGSSGNDTLVGGLGNDTLVGGTGNDSLTGSSGADRFLFDTNAVFAASSIGIDTITDFTVGTDKITIDKTTFTALSSIAAGALPGSQFAVVTTDTTAGSSTAAIVYNSTTGALFYNQDGSVAGLGTGGQFATLPTKPALTAADFLVQV